MSCSRIADNEQLDSVTIESNDGTHTTLTDELSYRVDGFHWQFRTQTPERLPPLFGAHAVGEVDGRIILRGIIRNAVPHPDELTEVFVCPPQ